MKKKLNIDGKVNKRFEKLALLLMVAMLALLLFNLGATYAKYRQGLSNNAVIVAKPFYLASNSIKGGYTKLEREADNSVVLDLDFRNYVDDLRINDESFEYSFKLELLRNGQWLETIDEFTGSFVASQKEEQEKQYVISEIENNMSLKATIETLDNVELVGYGKSLTQEFGFSDSVSKIAYEVTRYTEDSNIVMMYVGGAVDKAPITIVWPDNYEVNATGFTVISSEQGKMTIEAQLGAIYQIEFYKVLLDTEVDLSDFMAY